MPICLTCGITFPKKKRGVNRFCSSGCYYESLRKHIPWNKGLGIPKQKTFIVINSQKFVKIPLSKGTFSIIDENDFERVNCYKWHLTSSQSSKTHYAKTSIWDKLSKKNVDIKLHRFILGLSDRKILVDHKNLNGLDNRKSNLRIATASQNVQNSRKPNKWGYRGIYKDKKTWTARIRTTKKTIRIGGFRTSREAARKYDELARRHFGEFAQCNF